MVVQHWISSDRQGLKRRAGKASGAREHGTNDGTVRRGGGWRRAISWENHGRCVYAFKACSRLMSGPALWTGRTSRRAASAGHSFIRDPDSDVKGGVKSQRTCASGVRGPGPPPLPVHARRCLFPPYSHAHTAVHSLGIIRRHGGIRVSGSALSYGNLHVFFSRGRPSVPSSTTPALW